MSASRSSGVMLVMAAALIVPAAAAAQAVAKEAPLDDPRITLELLDADIRDALRLIARQGDVNIVISNKVTGTVTLELRDASLRETLDAIVKIGGFQYTIENNIVTVSTIAELLDQRRQWEELKPPPDEPPPTVQEVLLLELQYVDAERVLPVVEKLLSEGGTVALLKTSDHVAEDHNTIGVDPADGSDLQIGGRLSTTSQGQPAKSHTLVVVDLPERLDRIREVVESIDTKPVQVLIEARFVEISLDDEHKLGIDWNMVAAGAGAATPHTFPFGDSTLGSFDPHVISGSPGGVFPSAPNSVSTPTEAGLFTFGTLDLSTFTAVLQMIQRDSRIQVVSNPRIVVGDRHTATILVGERFPIFSTTVSDFGTVIEQLDHYEPIGVQLEVTPSVLNDDEIELFVRPSTSSLGPIVEGSTGLMVARINSRQIDTAVTVKDSQTVVLGGLITTRGVEERSRVPFLGSLPVLGKLFSHSSTRVERIDLVIFLTVAIIREHGLTDAQREMFQETAPGGDPLRTTSVGTQLEYSPSAPQY